MTTIYLLGDSTVEDNTPPFRGWGFAFRELTAEGIQVENHAKSGRSTKSFLDEGRFELVLDALKPGDYVMIQFGHNDEKDDAERHTDPWGSFQQNLNRFCDGAISRGAQPILLTPPCRRFFVSTCSLMYTHGEYAAAIRQLAQVRGIPLCDLKAMTYSLYLSLGKEKTAELFVQIPAGEHPRYPDGHDDMTHFNAGGAKVIAGLVADWMRATADLAHLIRTEENV